MEVIMYLLEIKGIDKKRVLGATEAVMCTTDA